MQQVETTPSTSETTSGNTFKINFSAKKMHAIDKLKLHTGIQKIHPEKIQKLIACYLNHMHLTTTTTSRIQKKKWPKFQEVLASYSLWQYQLKMQYLKSYKNIQTLLPTELVIFST